MRRPNENKFLDTGGAADYKVRAWPCPMPSAPPATPDEPGVTESAPADGVRPPALPSAVMSPLQRLQALTSMRRRGRQAVKVTFVAGANRRTG